MPLCDTVLVVQLREVLRGHQNRSSKLVSLRLTQAIRLHCAARFCALKRNGARMEDAMRESERCSAAITTLPGARAFIDILAEHDQLTRGTAETFSTVHFRMRPDAKMEEFRVVAHHLLHHVDDGKIRLIKADARELLGGLSSSAFYVWKKNPERVLEVDRITRISYLIGLYKDVHILYCDQLAAGWESLANT